MSGYLDEALREGDKIRQYEEFREKVFLAAITGTASSPWPVDEEEVRVMVDTAWRIAGEAMKDWKA